MADKVKYSTTCVECLSVVDIMALDYDHFAGKMLLIGWTQSNIDYSICPICESEGKLAEAIAEHDKK